MTTNATSDRDDIAFTDFAFAELGYTDFDDASTFWRLMQDHNLRFCGQRSGEAPGATNCKFEGSSGLELWTASNPLSTKKKPDRDGRQDERGYASYVYVRGRLPAVEPLYTDIIQRAGYTKEEFQPLQTEGGEILNTLREVGQ